MGYDRRIDNPAQENPGKIIGESKKDLKRTP
jgi:hypothetical protein